MTLTNLQRALPTHTEATAEVLPSSPSDSRYGEQRVIPRRVARLLVGIAAFFVAVREFISEEVQYVEGWWCLYCRDVHPDGLECPRAVEGQCDVCGVVILDAYLCCPNDRAQQHHIVKSSIKPRRQPATDRDPVAPSLEMAMPE